MTRRMWRVSWTNGTATDFADYPKRRQARAHEAALKALRGTRGGAEIVYWVRVWPAAEPTTGSESVAHAAPVGPGAPQGAEWATGATEAQIGPENGAAA
jgi:hypothetical protein